MKPTDIENEIFVTISSLIKKFFSDHKIPFYEYGKQDGAEIYFTSGLTLNISNLMIECKNISSDQWKSKVEMYLTLITKSQKNIDKVFDKSYEDIKDYIYPKMESEEMGSTMINDQPFSQVIVCYKILDYAITTIVIDYENIMIKISYVMFEKWNIPLNQLLEKAKENLYSKYRPQIIARNISSDIDMNMKYGSFGIDLNKIKTSIDVFELYSDHDSSNYVASNSIIISKFPKIIGKYGSLFAIPSRDCMVAYAINDINVLVAIEIYCANIFELYSKNSYQVSPFFYWYKDDKYTLLPYNLGANNIIEFQPPDEFVEMIFSINH